MAISWTQTAGDMATEALYRILALGSTAPMSDYQWGRARAHINGMLKLLQTQGVNQWRRVDQTVTLVEGQTSYVLSPRPDKVISVFHVDAQGRELPMSQWNYDEYDTLPVKGQKGRPNIWMEDRQRTQTNLFVWPTASAAQASLTLRVNYARVMEDVSATADIVDVPQEWLDPVTDVLAARLATNLRLENPSVEEVKRRGAAFLEEVLGHDSEHSITFVME